MQSGKPVTVGASTGGPPDLCPCDVLRGGAARIRLAGAKLLAETKDELRVHHIRMANKEGRADAEQAAVERIVAWCRDHYRPFRYSESALDFTDVIGVVIERDTVRGAGFRFEV